MDELNNVIETIKRMLDEGFNILGIYVDNEVVPDGYSLHKDGFSKKYRAGDDAYIAIILKKEIKENE